MSRTNAHPSKARNASSRKGASARPTAKPAPRDVEPEPISSELEELANDLIDTCLDALAEHGGFAPVLAAESEDGTRTLLSFNDEEMEECLDAAHDLVSRAATGEAQLKGLEGAPVRYAIGYDGAVREDDRGPYVNALIVEYGERGMSSAYSAYLLYERAGNPQEFMCSDPAAAGEMELLV